MTDKLIETIKADREAGTPGPWDTDEGGEVHHFGRTVFAWPLWSDQSDLERVQADMRRGKSVPDYEARILADAEVIKAAVGLADAADDQLVYMDMCDDIGDLEENLRAALTNFRQAQARAEKGGE